MFSFDGTDGTNPWSALIFGMAIPTTAAPGTFSCVGSGCDTIFKSLLEEHSRADTVWLDSDEAYPTGALVEGSDGNFYGTTLAGVAYGTVFGMTPSGMLTTLYEFIGNTDGGSPNGGLILATDGSFYGSTEHDGAYGYGTIFKVSTGLRPFVRTLPTLIKVGGAVIILGTNLTGATSVKFAGTPASFTVNSTVPRSRQPYRWVRTLARLRLRRLVAPS
jgi:uncharacterized repeat protein (TIGR03803 family)